MNKCLFVGCCALLAACSSKTDTDGAGGKQAAKPAAAASAVKSSGLDSTSIDAAVRLQDDLFRHVNGGWIARTQIPPDKASYGAFAELYDRTQAQLKNLVTSIPADTRDADA
ncbi:MAG: hypothetical protein KGJ55_02145, partial [Gammaproteobacteria bacterium]|nr:hypothetical protein [Gammaproteobacteria bacterium]